MNVKQFGMLRIALLALAVAAAVVISCSDDPARPKFTPAPRYPDATTPDIVISNLLKSYEDRNIEQFAKLLHPDYIWYNQLGVTPEFYTRSEDSVITGSMFLAALHAHPDEALWLDKLELLLAQGSWVSIVDIAGVPCEGCKETTREYEITLVMAGGAMTLIAVDLVQFIVAPVEVNGTTVYRILRCDDLRMQRSGSMVPVPMPGRP